MLARRRPVATADTPTRRSLAARAALVVAAAIALAPGCGQLDRHKDSKIPQLGVVDPDQPRELSMVSMPPYVIEPPDELEITVKPQSVELGGTTFVVQPEGIVDLGFEGDVYVAGLTLPQAESKIVQHLTARAYARGAPPKEPIQVSARLADETRSKFYYVMGAVRSPGRSPATGNDRVLDAILAAGLRPNSYPEKAYLVRPQPPGAPDLTLLIDWVGIKDRGDTTTNYQILPGDRIVVPGGKEPSLISSLLSGG